MFAKPSTRHPPGKTATAMLAFALTLASCVASTETSDSYQPSSSPQASAEGEQASSETVAGKDPKDCRQLQVNLENLLRNDRRHRKVSLVNPAIEYLIAQSEGWRISGLTQIGYLQNSGQGDYPGRTGGRIEWNWKARKDEWVCYGHFGYWGLGAGENRYHQMPISVCAKGSSSSFAVGDEPSDCLYNLRNGRN